MNIGKRGKSGEDRVAAFLVKRGFVLLKQNYQCRYGEIDIIAKTKEYIIFVEVKTRDKNSLFDGKDAVDIAKRQRMMLTAQNYLSKTYWELQPRFDVAEVTVTEENGKEKYSLNYIENAF